MPAELEGMNQLMNQLAAMNRAVDSRVTEKALNKGADLLKERIKESTPVRTGKLRENIIKSDVKDDKIDVGPDQQGNGFYGHFLEFGTKKAAPRPFMGLAFENSKGDIQDKMADVVKRELGL
jgi:HK97 gp10 family phage protein